ncbi:substrate-binding domain-containing protein [Fodinicola feengrottensis]|uniref:substrate-binding domain-containing protein n=1 Tax=Fodinicola feengrottensis TaxID=435914 RepID=UPI0013D37F25|nr:substrate-binding domain-containing protein [Fodinicola feengrottensis]
MQSHRRRKARRYRLAIAPWIVISAVAVLLLSGVTAGYAWLAQQGCKGAPTTLSVVADPDHAKILSSLAQQWTQKNPEIGGSCAAVSVASTKSGDVAGTLSPTWDPKRDGPRPDVWAPDSSTWIRVAQARPEAYSMFPTLQPSIARSPVVIAMPRPMALSLGWPNAPIDWRSLVTTFTGSHSWKDFKHPEWGNFQIGMTDPRPSRPPGWRHCSRSPTTTTTSRSARTS